jgi:hypothetical protein
VRFGNQSVVVVTVTEDPDNRDRYNAPALVRTPTTVHGCRFRPTPSTEVIADGSDKVTDPHKLTAPPVAAVMNMKNTDEIQWSGVTYQVVGLPRIHTDLAGREHHVTVLVARQLG